MNTIAARQPHLGRTARTALVTTACALCALPFAAHAQIAKTFTLGDLTYGENFDSMGTSAIYPAGWTGVRAGGSGTIGATLTPIVNAGTSTAGGIHNYGSAIDDRALGTIGSGATIPNFGTSFVNNTGGFIAGISLTGFMEQWRTGTNLLTETIFFEFSFDADSLLNTTATGTATWLPLSAMDLVEKVNSTTGAALDGNHVDNRTALTTGASPVPVGWGSGITMWIRWRDTDNTGSDAGLAIDDFTLTVTPGTAPKNILWSPSSNAWDLTASNWKEGATTTTFAAGDNVTFDDTGLAFNNVAIPAGGVTPATVLVDTTGTYTFTGGTITTLSPIQKSGTGTLVLGAPTTTGVTVNAGTFRTAASEVLGNSSTVVAGNGATVDFNNNNETIATMTLTGATVSTGTGLLTATGNYTVNTSPTDTATTINGRIATGTTTHKITVADSPGAAEDLILNASFEGAGRLDFDFVAEAMNATVRIAGDNSLHSGGLQLDSNLTYVIAHANALGTGLLFFNGGTFRPTIPLTGGNALAIPVSAGGNGVTFEGSDIDFSGAITFFGNGVKTYSVAAGQTVTFSGSLSSAGSPVPNSAITKQGPGTLVFAENGSLYTGALTVNGGTIVAATATALGSGPITLEASLPDTAILAATTSTTIGALNGGFGDGVKVLLGQTAPSVDPVVLTINSSSSGDYSGPIETVPGRTSALVKAGSGTQRLAGANSYTGTTTVSGGTLQFGKKVSLYNNVTANWTAANIHVASGATLAFNAGGPDEFTAADIQTLAALGTATGGFADGAILGLDTTNADGGTFTYGNVIADPNGGANDLGLTKLGSGTLILTQVNTYTGPTSVLGGELIFTQSEKLTALNIADGAIVTLGSASPAPSAAFEEPVGEGAGVPLQAVPEPGAVSLLAAGMLGLLRRRHQR